MYAKIREGMKVREDEIKAFIGVLSEGDGIEEIKITFSKDVEIKAMEKRDIERNSNDYKAKDKTIVIAAPESSFAGRFLKSHAKETKEISVEVEHDDMTVEEYHLRRDGKGFVMDWIGPSPEALKNMKGLHF